MTKRNLTTINCAVCLVLSFSLKPNAYSTLSKSDINCGVYIKLHSSLFEHKRPIGVHQEGMSTYLQTYRCRLLEHLLYSKYIYETLGMLNAEKINPKIRIIDLTGKFNNCEGFLSAKKSPLLIPYFVVQELKLSLNTGYFRDLVILSYKAKRKMIILNLFVASFDSPNGMNTGYLVEIQLEATNDKISIASEKASLYHESAPLVD
jgi:hypothetical protein